MIFPTRPDLEPISDDELADLLEQDKPDFWDRFADALRDPWNAVAAFIAGRPRLLAAVKAYAQARWFYTLYHDDGTVYMQRGWLLPKWCLRQEWHPYRGMYWDVRPWVPVRPRIHWIMTPDWDRELHDHPADYRTLVLEGYYVEEDIFGGRTVIVAGESERRRAQNFHRIDQVSEGGVVTLFTFFGGKRHDWGFLVGGRKVPHWDYTRGAA